MAARWYAFLRAINTGNPCLTNEQLLAPFAQMGFADAAAYQAAGNVAFTSSEPPDGAHIESVLADAYGFQTPTFVRSGAEVAGIVGADPFTPAEVVGTAGKVQVAFLRREPSAETVAELADLVPEGDLVRVVGRGWYWLPTDGIRHPTRSARARLRARSVSWWSSGGRSSGCRRPAGSMGEPSRRW